jgi:hypothetical protein
VLSPNCTWERRSLLKMSPALAGFAACHIGKGSEAGTGNLFVKSGVVRPDQNAPAIFARLIDACEAVAADAECQEIIAGVNAPSGLPPHDQPGFQDLSGRRGNAAAKRTRLRSRRLLRY